MQRSIFVVAAVVVAGSVYACSSGTSQGTDGGADSGNEAAVVTGGGDGGSDAGGDAGLKGDASPYAACVEAGTTNDCAACCDSVDPGAGDPWNNFIDNCSCDAGGACTQQCFSTYCVDNHNLQPTCDTCLKNTCTPGATANCNQDGKCSAWLKCVLACP